MPYALCQIVPHVTEKGYIQYLKYLMSQCNNKRIALTWDGAKYHSSAEVKDFLSLVNNGLDESERTSYCLKISQMGSLKKGNGKEEGRRKREEERRAGHGFGQEYTDEFNCVSFRLPISPSPHLPLCPSIRPQFFQYCHL